jgi:outer membrane biosynthesis protein TonB
MTLDQRNSPTLLLGIIGGLVAIIVLFLAYQWFFSTSSEAIPEHEAISLETPEKPAVTELKPTETEPVIDEKTIQLVDEKILKAPVPENESLLKEEVAKLDDIQSQLNEQESMLKTQHTDADDLIALKEEQIKLLEAQLKKSNSN